jgi:hypothetical protein
LRFPTAAAALLTAALAGCQEQSIPVAPPIAPAGTTQQPAAPAIEEIDVTRLPALGDTSPPLDGGRLEAAGPADWSLAPRRPEWLIAYRITPSTAYPILMVNAEDATGKADTTAENAAALGSEIAAAESQGMVEEPWPVKLGERYWVQYLRHAKAGDNSLERLILATVIGGRRYTVELRTQLGTADTYRAQAQAVAAGLRLTAPAAGAPQGSETPSEPGATDDAAAEPPAEEGAGEDADAAGTAGETTPAASP